MCLTDFVLDGLVATRVAGRPSGNAQADRHLEQCARCAERLTAMEVVGDRVRYRDSPSSRLRTATWRMKGWIPPSSS